MTRQAHYQHFWYVEDLKFEQELIIKEAIQIRKRHPRMGVRKIYELLHPFMLEHHIKMGRDALFDLLANNKMLVKRRKKAVYTTNSFHYLRKYPNLIRDLVPEASNQLWVSDITYWKVGKSFLYISLITDAYSHKIVGYQLANTLEAIESIQALKMAIESNSVDNDQLIHHSDRGIQYCSYDYVKILTSNNITISMTENGDPLENAIAERVNGILKDEYLECYEVNAIEEAKLLLKQVIDLYNTERPHMSIGNRSPENIHQNNQETVNLLEKLLS